MICKICAQALDESARAQLADYSDDTYNAHLSDAHGYPAPAAPASLPAKTNAELTEELDQVYLTLVEFANRLDALEGGPVPIETAPEAGL